MCTFSHIGMRSFVPFTLVAVLGAMVLGACASDAEGDSTAQSTNEFKTGLVRDWQEHPAIVRFDAPKELYAISDPHGSYTALVELFKANHLISNESLDPAHASDTQWEGGRAFLIVAGDMIDKGGESLGVVDLLRTLQEQAPERGGRVVVTLGNHEAEFFDDPENDKANSSSEDAIGINNELKAAGIKPRDLARGFDKEGRGLWLHNLPFAAKVGKWFFSHGGNTNGKSFADLNKKLSNSLDHNGWGDRDITGSQSILELQGWYGDPEKDDIGHDYAKALDVNHIAFGHDPGAFNDRGHIRISKDGTLVKLDVGLGSHVDGDTPSGELLHVIFSGGEEEIETLDVAGKSKALK